MRASSPQSSQQHDTGARQRRLLVSIHDVAPIHESDVDRLRDVLLATAGPDMTLLVVPNFWGRSPVVRGSHFATRLRDWCDAGAEIFLHGYYHRDDTSHQSAIARFKATKLTAREGEFLGLDRQEAGRRITAGRQLLEDVVGRSVAGFVAPAWLYGVHGRAALHDAGITIAEDHWSVWSPAENRVLAKSPVVTWASRSRSRVLSSLAVAALARQVPRPRVMRIGVHPGDCRVPPIMTSIASTVSCFRTSHRPSRYHELLHDG